MANLTDIYKKASLVMKPAAMKEGKLYSQQPHSGAGDFTFSRANGVQTRINEHGLIESVADNTPRLSYDWVTKEDARTNLIEESESFNDSYWTKARSVLSNASEAPDGSPTAYKLYDSTDNNTHIIYRSFTVSTSSEYTFSCFIKKGTISEAFLAFDAQLSQTVVFDLENGVVLSQGVSASSSSISEAGNGYYRCSVTHTPTTTTRLYRIGTYNESISYTGSGSDYVEIFGAQLEEASSATDYIPTNGESATIPAVVVASECPTLLLEPTRRNLIDYSEEFNQWTLGGGASVTPNQSISPDGSNTADKLTSSATNSLLYRSISYSNNSTVVFSVFVKNIDATNIKLSISDTATGACNITFAFSSESITAANSGSWTNTSGSFEEFSNGWYRVTIKSTKGAGSTILPRIEFTESGKNVFAWGAQLEDNGSFGSVDYPTSYIPTAGSQVTRTVDSCINGGDANLFNITEGTLFVDTIPFTREATERITLSNNNFNNRILISKSSSTQLQFIIVSNNVTVATYITNINYNERNKIALNFKANEFKFYLNGSLLHTDTSGSVPTGLNDLSFKGVGSALYWSGKIYQTMVFNEALTDSELITLTT